MPEEESVMSSESLEDFLILKKEDGIISSVFEVLWKCLESSGVSVSVRLCLLKPEQKYRTEII